MAAEIIVIIENENARAVTERAAIEPRRGEPADAAADHDQIVSLFDRRILDAETPALVRKSMRHFERAGMLTAQPGQCRRIGGRRSGDLRGGSEAGADRQSGTAEKVAACDGRHSENLPSRVRR